jgi:hypothetical protein
MTGEAERCNVERRNGTPDFWVLSTEVKEGLNKHESDKYPGKPNQK